MRNTDHAPIDTLRLAETDLRKILDRLDETQRAACFDAERRSPRIPFRTGRIVVTVWEFDGRRATYAAYSRNISEKGVAFLLGLFVYPGSRTMVTLTFPDGDHISLPGTILRSRYLEGRAHEVAVEFDSPISLDSFAMQEEQASGPLRLKQPPESIRIDGRALIVNFKPDRRIIRHFLEKAGMSVQDAADPEQAVNAMKSGGYDVVILDEHLENLSGLAVATALRGSGFAGPILVCTTEEGEDVTVRATAAGCNGYLAKPLDRQVLLDTVSKLLADSPAKPSPAIRSAFADDMDTRPMIEGFLATLQRSMNVLKRCVDSKLASELRLVCMQLKGAAATYGFPELTNEAGKPIDELQQPTPSWDEIRHTVSNLIHVMNQLRL